MKKFIPMAQKKLRRGAKGVDVHTRVHTGAEVFETVGEGVCKLDVACSTGFLHMVAGD